MKQRWREILVLLLIAILPFILLTCLVFLQEPPPWPDEAIFLQSAQTLIHSGVLATNLFGNVIPGLSQHAAWYPQFYFYLLAVWIYLFGSSIETIRLLSFIIALLCFPVLFFSLQMYFKRTSYAFFGTLLLSFDFTFAQAAHVARMDILNFFFLLCAIFFYLLTWERKQDRYFLFCGICCAMAVVTHPLGVLGVGIIFLHMIFKKVTFKEKLKQIALVVLPVILLSGVWVFSMRDYLSLFFEQYHLQVLRKAMEIPDLIILFQTSTAWWLLLLCYSVIFIFFGFIFFFKKREGKGLFLLIGMTVSFVALMWGKELWYELYLQPFCIFIFIYCWQYIKEKKSILRFFPAGVLIFLILTNLYLVFQKYNSQKNYHAYTEAIMANMPAHTIVLLSAIPDPYFDLQTTQSDQFYEFPTVPFDNGKYISLLDRVDVVIFNYPSSSVLGAYLQKNAQSIIQIGQEGNYRGIVVLLKPKNERTHKIFD